MTRLPKTVCQCLAICLPFCQTLADTVAGRADAPGQTQKVAVVEGPVILRAAANAAVLDAYKGAAGELAFAAEEPYDLRLHAGDGKTGGWSVFRDYVLPLWENRWISWGDNVADATGELRMHGHPVALSAGWKLRANGVLAISYGTNAVAWFGSANAGGRILDYAVATNGEHRVTCVAIEGDAAQPRLQTTTSLAEAVWADAEGVVTNRIDASTVELVATPAAGNAFFRVVWSDGLADGLTVRGAVAADGFSCGGTTVTNFGDLATTGELADAVAPLATKAALVAVSNAQTNYLPLAGGTLDGAISIGSSSLPPTNVLLAVGTGHTVNGNNTIAVGQSNSGGANCSIIAGRSCRIVGWDLVAFGYACEALANRAVALGSRAKARHQYSFVWNGRDVDYSSHGAGSWNCNPQGGVTNAWIGETNLADHISAAVAPVESRVDELEEQAEEYWCKWTSVSLSDTATNWIPTNWPARNVHCVLVLNTTGVTNVVALPDWTPTEARTLELYIYKTAIGAGTMNMCTGENIATATGTSSTFFKCKMIFRPGIGWFCERHAVSQPVIFLGKNKFYPTTSALPEDARFAPVILEDPPAQTLSMSPALSPGLSPSLDIQPDAPSLSPSFSPSVVPALDNFDATEPEAFEPLADPSDEETE